MGFFFFFFGVCFLLYYYFGVGLFFSRKSTTLINKHRKVGELDMIEFNTGDPRKLLLRFAKWEEYSHVAHLRGVGCRLRNICSDMFPPTNDSIHIKRPNIQDANVQISIQAMIDSPTERIPGDKTAAGTTSSHIDIRLTDAVYQMFIESAEQLLLQYAVFGLCYWEVVVNTKNFGFRALTTNDGEVYFSHKMHQAFLLHSEGYGKQKEKRPNSHVYVINQPKKNLKMRKMDWAAALKIKNAYMDPSGINLDPNRANLGSVRKLYPNSLFFPMYRLHKRRLMYSDLHDITAITQTTQPYMLQAVMPPVDTVKQQGVRSALRSYIAANRKNVLKGHVHQIPAEYERGYAPSQVEVLLTSTREYSGLAQTIGTNILVERLKQLPTGSFERNDDSSVFSPLLKPVFRPNRSDPPHEVEIYIDKKINRYLNGIFGAFITDSDTARIKSVAEQEYVRNRQRLEYWSRVCGKIFTVVWRSLVDAVNRKRRRDRGKKSLDRQTGCCDIVQVIPRNDPPPEVVQTLLQLRPDQLEFYLAEFYNISPHRSQPTAEECKKTQEENVDTEE